MLAIRELENGRAVRLLDDAWDFVRGVAASGRPVLFVGTKKQAQDSIEEHAKRVGMPYVNFRWLGGMLTNFTTIKKRIALLEQLEARQQAGDVGGFGVIGGEHDPAVQANPRRADRAGFDVGIDGLLDAARLLAGVDRAVGTDDPHVDDADGLVEALSAKMFQLQEVHVASSSAVEKALGHDQPIAKIAQALGVNLILQGTVQGTADKLRITLDLEDVAGGRRVWSLPGIGAIVFDEFALPITTTACASREFARRSSENGSAMERSAIRRSIT